MLQLYTNGPKNVESPKVARVTSPSSPVRSPARGTINLETEARDGEDAAPVIAEQSAADLEAEQLDYPRLSLLLLLLLLHSVCV